jgi:seryl-tRNA synthetase
VHSSVTVSNTEDDNAVIRTWAPEGVKVEKRDCLSHHEVLYRIGGYDPERGVKVVGHRGYCLTDYGFFLNRELPTLKAFEIQFLTMLQRHSYNMEPNFCSAEGLNQISLRT